MLGISFIHNREIMKKHLYLLVQLFPMVTFFLQHTGRLIEQLFSDPRSGDIRAQILMVVTFLTIHSFIY